MNYTFIFNDYSIEIINEDTGKFEGVNVRIGDIEKREFFKQLAEDIEAEVKDRRSSLE